MYKNKRYIFASYFLLLVFISWQTLVFTHRHKAISPCDILTKTISKSSSHFDGVVVENCELCTILIHNLYDITALSLKIIVDAILISQVVLAKRINCNFLLKWGKSRAPPMPLFTIAAYIL